MTAAPGAEFIFKSRRSMAAGDAAAGLQADAGRAGAVAAAPAELFRPFAAFALCWPAHRKGAPVIVVTRTLSRLRSDVRAAYLAAYGSADEGNAHWASDLRRGAFIARVIVSPDPTFVLPRGARR